MEKLTLVIGALLTLLNTLVGLIMSDYPSFNILVADLSLILSTGLIFRLLESEISGTSEVILTYIFCATGIVRWICMIVTSPETENNVAMNCAVTLLFFEIICLFTTIIIEKKNRK